MALIRLGLYPRGYDRIRRDWFDGRSGCCGADQVRELLKHLQMLIAEYPRRAGEHFQNSGNAASAVDRNDGDGSDSDGLTDLGIHPAVIGDVLTA